MVNFFCDKENFRNNSINEIAKEITNSTNVKRFANKFKLLATIRDPIERFISSFVNKCVIERPWSRYKGNCLNCFSDVECVIKRMYQRLKRKSLDPIRLKSNDYYERHFYPTSFFVNSINTNLYIILLCTEVREMVWKCFTIKLSPSSKSREYHLII
uniref:Carbohydrate sulfotransferase n=1 Tax=Rhabditophanes sp. KR3021 TaxID=114890 RepID=A0AC35TNA6_9BILA